MLPLPDDLASRFLKDFFGDSSRSYFWETLQNIEWSGDRPVTDFLVADSYVIVFDPNAWVMPSCIQAARYFGQDDAPLGYQLSTPELIVMSRQPWVGEADFYVFKQDGSLCALRTHEDSGCGFWILTPERTRVKAPL